MPARRPPETAGSASSPRLRCLDNLKTLLIIAIIAGHAALGYAGAVEVWTYTEFREASLAPVTELVLFVGLAPFALFMMPLFFLVAGLLTPASLDRQGTTRFVSHRLLRLGVPFLAYVLVVQPVLKYALVRLVGDGSSWADATFAEVYLAGGRLDTGPLWFVGVLLVFSLVAAAQFAWASRRAARRPGRWDARPPRELTARRLLLLALAVAPASFAVRLLYPYGSESGFTDLSLWEWPACAAVFALGVREARRGLVSAVPERVFRDCRNLTLCAVGAMASLMVAVVLLDRVDDALGGWGWPAAVFAAVEAVLTVTGSVWMLGVAQRRLERTYRGERVLTRAAYGAFMLQTPFLLGLAVLVRPVEVPAELKAIVVAVGAVTCSFAVAHLLIHKVAGIGRVL